MSNWPFRFLHAADFHLEQPLVGVTEVPDHLAEMFVEAAYLAAERVFEIARSEAVDFVVLSGNLLAPGRTGPRGPIFLVEQFRQLAERDIAVYWCGGRIDPPDSWPAAIRLPENVHVFSSGRPDEIVHERDGQPVARVMGSSRGSRRRIRTNDFARDPGGLFTLAAANGSAETEALQSRQIDYWALGGQTGRKTLYDVPQTAHYPGTPQGRRPEDTDAFGCTLVHVDDRNHARLTFLPTSMVQWQTEQITVSESTTRAELENMLHERARAIRGRVADFDVLVSWVIAGIGPLMGQLREGGFAADLLESLRIEHGFGPPSTWSLSLMPEATAVLPADWYEQQTILGDFLRDIRSHQISGDESLELESYLSEQQLAGTLSAAANLSDPVTRDQVLREAALLGVDLLSGEES